MMIPSPYQLIQNKISKPWKNFDRWISGVANRLPIPGGPSHIPNTGTGGFLPGVGLQQRVEGGGTNVTNTPSVPFVGPPHVPFVGPPDTGGSFVGPPHVPFVGPPHVPFVGPPAPEESEMVDAPVPPMPPPRQRQAPANRPRRRFGPPGPTGFDFANNVLRNMALGHMQRFFNAPYALANQFNQNTREAAERGLILNQQRLMAQLGLAGINQRDRSSRRALSAIRSIAGGIGGAGAGGALPWGSIANADAAQRGGFHRVASQVGVSPSQRYANSRLLSDMVATRAPDVERQLLGPNRALGLNIDRARVANAAPLMRYI